MKVIVIGAGFTGVQLARELVAVSDEVVLMDIDAERVRHASDQLDCTVVEADGRNLRSLERAGLASADALVALTENDEVNMIVCSLADSVYPWVSKIARVRSAQRQPDTARARDRIRISASSRAATISSVMARTGTANSSSSMVTSRQRAFARRW